MEQGLLWLQSIYIFVGLFELHVKLKSNKMELYKKQMHILQQVQVFKKRKLTSFAYRAFLSFYAFIGVPCPCIIRKL